MKFNTMVEVKIEDTKKRFFVSFKENLRRWCHVTTCAGILDLYMAKGVLGKLFWTIFIGLCFGFTSMQIVDVFRTFFTDNPYQSQTSMVGEEKIPFPNVTICNFNRIDETLIGDVDREVFSYVFQMSGTNYNMEMDFENLTDIFEPRWAEVMKILNVSNSIDLSRKYGHNCEDTFIFCKWQTEKFDCCNFTSEVILSYGRCWTILPNLRRDPNNIVHQSFPGIYYGLELAINPKLNSYLKNVLFNNMLEQGVMVMVGYSDIVDLFDYKVVEAGMHSWMALEGRLETVKHYRTPMFPPWCRTNATLNYLTSGYSKENCEVDCWAEMFIKNCNCTNIGITKNRFSTCSTLVYYKCIMKILKNMSSTDVKLEECRKGCKNACYPVWSARMSQTTAKFIGNKINLSSVNYWHDLLGNESYRENILNSMIALNIYFSSMTYMKIEIGETYPILNFIADIGGQLSLFLGISIVTIVQMVWYFCVWLFPKICEVDYSKID